MGDMQKGVWRAEENFPRDRSGHFIRPDAPFRNWVTADGEPGPTGAGGFKAEPGRYHLYHLARLPLGAPHADLPRGSRGSRA